MRLPDDAECRFACEYTDAVTVYLYDTGCTEQGRLIIGYRVIVHGTPLFEGVGLRVAKGVPEFSAEAADILMRFLTARPRCVDDPAFTHYTNAQLEWILSAECEALSRTLNSLEDV